MSKVIPFCLNDSDSLFSQLHENAYSRTIIYNCKASCKKTYIISTIGICFNVSISMPCGVHNVTKDNLTAGEKEYWERRDKKEPFKK